MGFALWVVGALFLLVFLGTYAIQAVLVLLMIAGHLLRLVIMVVFGLLSLVILAIVDRPGLMRILRAPHAGI